MSVKKWPVKKRETVFQKYGRGVERVDFELPNGEVADFYVKKEKDNVCILALTRDKEVILARQFRPGPEEILFELPGGGIDAGRNARTAAIRELLEETGIPGEYAICGQSARLWLFHNAP